MRVHTEGTRAKRIADLIERLESGGDVQARDLKIVLGLDRYKGYRQRWQEQMELRGESKPDDVITYESKLHAALLAYARYERYSSVQHSRSNIPVNRVKKTEDFKNAADAAFEGTLEFLMEAFERDPGIQRWFDRPLSFDFDTEISIDPVGMPRVVTSRSLDNLSNKKHALGLVSKRELKLAVLREALEPLTRGETEADEADEADEAEQKAKLRVMLARLKDDAR